MNRGKKDITSRNVLQTVLIWSGRSFISIKNRSETMQTLGPHQLRYATSWNISHLILHKFWVSNGSIKLKIADTTEFIPTATIWKNYFLVTKLTNFYWNQSEMITFSSLCVYYTNDFCWVYVQFCNFLANFCNSATFCYYVHISFL